MANRMMRADNEIIKVISDIVLNKLRDPRLSKFITITRAKTSPDFRFCRVGVSVLSDSINEKKETLKQREHMILDALGYISYIHQVHTYTRYTSRDRRKETRFPMFTCSSI